MRTNYPKSEFYKEILTDKGIIIIDGIDNNIIKIIPNNNHVVKMLRDAINLWESGNISALDELYCDKNKIYRKNNIRVIVDHNDGTLLNVIDEKKRRK